MSFTIKLIIKIHTIKSPNSTNTVAPMPNTLKAISANATSAAIAKIISVIMYTHPPFH